MSILQEILAQKRTEVKAKKKAVTLHALMEKELFSFRRLSLKRALRRQSPAVIAEVKRASPSRGVIRNDFDPLAIAREYTQNAAAALSVLTEEKFFQGDLRYIERMKKFVSIPILRKDFIFDSYQLYEAKACGADAVLLIVAALDRSQLHDLHDEAQALDMECLVEIHSERELEQVDIDKVELLGMNNRNLATFVTNIAVSMELRRHVPTRIEIVSESGINTASDVRQLMANGINSFLIGETFMRAESPGKALAELLQQIS